MSENYMYKSINTSRNKLASGLIWDSGFSKFLIMTNLSTAAFDLCSEDTQKCYV